MTKQSLCIFVFICISLGVYGFENAFQAVLSDCIEVQDPDNPSTNNPFSLDQDAFFCIWVPYQDDLDQETLEAMEEVFFEFSNDSISHFEIHSPFSFNSFWESLYSKAYSGYEFLNRTFNTVDQYIIEHLRYSNYPEENIIEIAEALFHKPLLAMFGFYYSHPRTGVLGAGEISDTVRITMINGILNIHENIFTRAEMISELHGDVNVHYIFRPTEGLGWDLLKSLATKLGYVSPQAIKLAETWKEMIEEMGGIESPGVIYHYAHSIGGADTLVAKSLLTSEEQKKIYVRTFGSPTMLPDEDFSSVINYVSLRDGVCYLDPVGYFKGLFGIQDNVIFVGTIWGIPIIDHAFCSDTYRSVIAILGQQFIEKYRAGIPNL